jgi:hypothetical protein
LTSGPLKVTAYVVVTATAPKCHRYGENIHDQPSTVPADRVSKVRLS